MSDIKENKVEAANEPSPEATHEDGDMVAVKKEEILPGLPLPTDVFVRLQNGKYLMLAKRGTKSSLEELHVSQSEQVSNFYIRRQDYSTAVDQNLKIAGILARRPDIPVARRSTFIRTAAESVFKEFEHMGITAAGLNHSRQTVGAICSLVQSREDYYQLVEAMNDLPGTIVKEAIAGAALSALIAQSIGWTNRANIEKLVLGAFLRDVGLKELPPAILQKPRAAMSNEERAIWETHAYRGAEILQKVPEMPVEAVAIALEHHENSLGQGFPRRIRDSKINPFAKIVSLADFFVHLTVPSSSNIEVKSPELAMHYLEYTLGCPFNKAIVVGLKRALGLETMAPGAESVPSKAQEWAAMKKAA